MSETQKRTCTNYEKSFRIQQVGMLLVIISSIVLMCYMIYAEYLNNPWGAALIVFIIGTITIGMWIIQGVC